MNMNIYKVLGDRIGTLEARALAEELVAWHDAMVRHLRLMQLQGRGCSDECPHSEARLLWRTALEVFGDGAERLRFLQDHGAPGGHERLQAIA
jgi:hypothetical protein